MKVRFAREQIMAMIKEQESGEKTADVCRRHGISSARFYRAQVTSNHESLIQSERQKPPLLGGFLVCSL